MKARVAALMVAGLTLVGTPVLASWQKAEGFPQGGEYGTTTVAQTYTTPPTTQPATTTPTTVATTPATTTPREVTTTTHRPYTTTTSPTTIATTTTTDATTTTASPTTSTTTATSSTTAPSSTTTIATTSTTTTQPGATTTTTEPAKKVFVCKFVGTPGVDETLQTGQNPISVSINAIPIFPVVIGSFFADAQGRSLVIAFDIGQDEPSILDCVFPPPTTTTTTGVPTSTTTTNPSSSTTTSPSSTSTIPTSTTTSSVPSTTTSTSTTVAPSTTTTAPSSTTTEAPKKVWVCKFVGTPGDDERLQTGQNPISVSVNSIPNWSGVLGEFFADQQGRSFVLAFDNGGPEPDVSQCLPTPPTTTTTTTPGTSTSSTSTTIAPTTTTSTVVPTSTSTTVAPTTTSTTSSTTTSTSTTTTQPPATTTTTVAPTTTSSTTTSSSSTTSTTILRPSLLGIDDFAFCGDDNLPEISITFGNRPDLDGTPGLLTFSDGTDYSGNPLVFQSGQTVTFPYPASLTTPLTLTYANSGETATAVVTLPEDCPPEETTTSTSSTSTTTPTTTTSTTVAPTTTSTAPTTSSTAVTTTTTSSTTTTSTLPETFTFGAAGAVCVREVPTIRITFQTPGFPSLAGVTGTLTMRDINGNLVSTQPLVYAPGSTVDILYPGTRVNADGSIADVPGWILTSDGFWIQDPSDEFLRDGIFLTYQVNPTAGPVLVTYPPESSACANPDGPFPPLRPNLLPPTA